MLTNLFLNVLIFRMSANGVRCPLKREVLGCSRGIPQDHNPRVIRTRRDIRPCTGEDASMIVDAHAGRQAIRRFHPYHVLGLDFGHWVLFQHECRDAPGGVAQ